MARTLPPHLVGHDVRETILDHADALLARFGYARFTVDDLARAVGIGKGTIYLHFQSKEEVALSVIDRVVLRVESALAAIADGDAPAPERLHAMLVARVLGRFDSFAHYQGSVPELLGALRPALQERREQLADREAGLFARVITEGRRTGALAPRKPLETARLLMLGTEALMLSNLSARELGDRATVEAQARALATVLVDGIRGTPRDDPSPARRARAAGARARSW
jgi:AcrR family transcriptional regulator